jgi:hypothetical protein
MLLGHVPTFTTAQTIFPLVFQIPSIPGLITKCHFRKLYIFLSCQVISPFVSVNTLQDITFCLLSNYFITSFRYIQFSDTNMRIALAINVLHNKYFLRRIFQNSVLRFNEMCILCWSQFPIEIIRCSKNDTIVFGLHTK